MPSENIDHEPRLICSCGEEILAEYWEDGELVRVHVGSRCTLCPTESGNNIPPLGSKFFPGGRRSE